MLKVTSIGDLPKSKIEYIFDELQLKYNIHEEKNINTEGEPQEPQYYNFSQEIYYGNKEVVPYLIEQINILSKIIFELFKYTNVDEESKELILKGFIEQYKHEGLTGNQFKELTIMLNKSRSIEVIQKDELTKDFEFCIDEELKKLNEEKTRREGERISQSP